MNIVKTLLRCFAPPAFGFGGGGGAPPPPPPPDTRSMIPPMMQSPQGSTAAQGVRRRAASTRGYGGTIVTGPQGLTAPAPTQQNTLKPTLGG